MAEDATAQRRTTNPRTVIAWTVGRTVAAALMIAAVGGSLQISVGSGIFVFWNFFGYFTIQNNLIGATALLVAAHFTGKARPQWVEFLRVSAAVYLGIVVTVYWILLAPTENELTHWTNLILHLLSGVFLVIDWLLEGPREGLPLRRVWIVLMYPIAWLAVVLIRGATDGWFPYPFLDPATGYGSIAVVILGIIVGGLVVGSLLYRATRWRVITPS
jgi:hypothetical protein